MPDMEAPVEDALEQGADERAPARAERDIEAPEADAVEQETPIAERETVVVRSLPDEANEADVAEQTVVVENEDDEYR